jgi:hypothetical protein
MGNREAVGPRGSAVSSFKERYNAGRGKGDFWVKAETLKVDGWGGGGFEQKAREGREGFSRQD